LQRKLHTLIYPFLLWNLTLILLDVGGYRHHFRWALLYGLTGVWQLYYVFALIQLLLLKDWLQGWIRQKPRLFFWSAAGLSLLYYGAADLWFRWYGTAAAVFETELNRLVFPWLFFFATGIWLRHTPGALEWLGRKRWWLGLVMAASYALYHAELRWEDQQVSYTPLEQILPSGFPFQWAGALLLMLGINQWGQRPALQGAMTKLTRLAPYTYGVYLSHTTVLTLLYRAYQHLDYLLPENLEIPALALLAGLGAFGFCWLIRHLPWQWPALFLLGSRRIPWASG